MAQVLGILKNPEDTIAAIHSLKGAGFSELEVYSPVPSHGTRKRSTAARRSSGISR
jgi:hypothetical protein